MRYILFALAILAILAIPSMALAENQPPVADAGGDQAAYTGDVVYLNGSATDAENDPIQWWWWTVTSAPTDAVFTLYAEFSQNAVLQASTPGTYLVSLIVDDGFATSAPDTIAITVADNLPPVAIATADKTEGPAPLTVQFDGSQSYDPEGKPIAEYYWDFGDGTAGSFAAVPPPHTYLFAGVYNVVALTVSDERGAFATDVLVITVTEPVNNPPVASPTATPNSGTAPLAVQFAANAVDPEGDAITYAWDFGDGATSTVANPAHVFTTPGDFVTWLTVSDGKSNSYSLTISVSPQIAFSVASASVKWIKNGMLADVSVDADFAAPLPAAADTIRMTFDGVELFAVPFSAFKNPGGSGVFLFNNRDTHVSLDFANNALKVFRTKTVMTGFDPANGVEVRFDLGALTAVENIGMTETHGDRLVYQRP